MNFTELFQTNIDTRLNINSETADPHAFFFLENLIKNISQIPKVFQFEDFWNYKLTLDSSINYSIKLFELEASMLVDNKSIYINSTIENLKILEEPIISSRMNLRAKYTYQLGLPEANIYHVLGMLKDCIAEILINIDKKFASHFSKENRDYVAFFKKPQEFYRSFSLIQTIESRRFEKIFHRFGPFISRETSFESFKALFQNTFLEKKIIWVGTKSALCYFVQQLISNKVIIDPKNKHWKIVSQNFLLRGEFIPSEKLLNQKSPNPHDIAIINSIMEIMKF